MMQPIPLSMAKALPRPFQMKPINQEGNVEWFSGNLDGLAILQFLSELLHTWDDLIDLDKPLTESSTNRAFLICLVGLPMNPVYQRIQTSIAPLWLSIVSAYETANHFERTHDEHGLEIAHTLRYAAGQIVALAMIECQGYEQAQKYMPAMWKACVFERFEPYRKEHAA